MEEEIRIGDTVEYRAIYPWQDKRLNNEKFVVAAIDVVNRQLRYTLHNRYEGLLFVAIENLIKR